MGVANEAALILHLTFGLTFMILGSLSKIFGTVKKSKPVYRLHYFATGLCFLPIFLTLFSALVGLSDPWLRYVTHFTTASDVIALTLGAYATYFYWNWLPKEIRQ